MYTKLIQTQEVIKNPFVTHETATIQMSFNNLKKAFITIHRAISHTKPIHPSLLPEMHTAVDNYFLRYSRMSHSK